MRVESWKGVFLLGLVTTMFLILTACGPGKSASQTAVAETAVQQTAVEATRIAPTNTPIPTETPTPTETPIPTPTEVKVFMQDEEGDCEPLTGSIAEEGCQIDIKLFEVFPCENPGFYTFKVYFNRIPFPEATDLCFLINTDGDLATGLANGGFAGVDVSYCSAPRTGVVLLIVYGPSGDSQETIPVENPNDYIGFDSNGVLALDPFSMDFPPVEFEGAVLTDLSKAVAQALYHDMVGNMVFDESEAVILPVCPVDG